MSFHPSMGAKAQARPPSRITCVLPGLVWPGSGLSATLQNLELPGLAALLGRAKTQRQPAEPYAQWLAKQFGAEQLSWGALRWAGEALDAPHNEAHTLCADPVSLAFSQSTLLLKGPRELALQPEEVAALIESLNAEFATLGHFHAASPERWYLHTTQPVATHFYPLADVIGRPASLFQPEGERARDWAQHANAIQILLYNHPVNRAREARGQLLANALWFWGQPAAQTKPLHAPAATLIGHEPTLRGLAAASGAHWRAPADAAASGHSWHLDTRLQEATQNGDFYGWLAALQSIDAELLQPLAKAWHAGQLKSIELIAPCDKTLLHARLGTPQRLAFWRAPLCRSAMVAVLQAPIAQES